MRRAVASLISSFVLPSLLLLTPACNRRVFRQVKSTCDSTIPVDLEIPTQRAADILIVVDNSVSMGEEQARLVENFLNQNRVLVRDQNGSEIEQPECPLEDLTAIPEQFKNPGRELDTGDGPLAKCGFIQLLAAFDNDFRVGVITTDVGMCDNRFGEYGTENFRPQRGCLQPDGPTREGGNLVLERSDLERAASENKPELKDFAARFGRTLANIGTRGSAFERGLDAMEIFLDESSVRSPGCENDLALFRRPGAELVVIVLSDEEDCSHADGAFGFPDENALGTSNQLTCGVNARDKAPQEADRCYRAEPELAPVSRYVEAVRRADAGAKIAIIAGLVPDRDAAEGFSADGCLAPPAGGEQVPLTSCYESHGSSVFVDAEAVCSDAKASARESNGEEGPCCVADPGSRYLDFAAAFQTGNKKSFLLDSICSNTFRNTMIQIAEFIAATSFVDLVEPPVDGMVSVTLIRGGEAQTVQRIPANACDSATGWFLDGPQRVALCGEAIPQPGERLEIRAKGHSESPDCLARAAEEMSAE